MTIWQAIALGLTQGLTEFLPVSSSAHLAFVPEILRIPQASLAFNVLMHLGTLLAVVYYFRRDLWRLAADGWRGKGDARRILLLLFVGSLPAGALGYLGHDLLERLFASPAATAWQLAVTGGLLYAADRCRTGRRGMGDLNPSEALFIGLGQALAIVPGISRSGATIAFGLWRGLARDEAARYSFLLSIPAIAGAGLFEAKPLLTGAVAGGFGLVYLAGFIAAALSGGLSIAVLLRYLERGRLLPFAVYCWFAAGAFLAFLALR